MYGGSNRLPYDHCAYQKRLYESTSPLMYQLYEGAHEHCGKCTYEGRFYRIGHGDLVDYESDLRGITRPATKCDQFKYSPTCTKSEMCISTFDPSFPITPAPELCPIVRSNIPRWLSPGYILPSGDMCVRARPTYMSK